MSTVETPTCFRCGRGSDEISEYTSMVTAGEYNSTVAAVMDDGTYNPQTNHFCCTHCYIAIGMPGAMGGWKAP